MDSLGPFNDPAMVRSLVGDGMVLFVAVSADATIGWMGASALPILGRPAEDLVGTSIFDLLHPDDHELVIATLAESARNADERILANLRVGHADGSWVTLEFGGIDLREPDGSGAFLVWGRNHESTGRLLDFLGSLLAGGDLHGLLDQVVRWCDALAPWSSTVVVVRDDDGAYRAAASAELPAPIGHDLHVDAQTPGPWVASITRGETAELATAVLDPRLAEAAAGAGVPTVWSTPIHGGAGPGPAGVLVTWRHREGKLLATHKRHLEDTARLSQLALEWASTHGQLVAAATTDALTGVPNRTQLDAHVRTDRSALAAVLFCDLDHFKDVNDEHGHVVGDHVLQAVAHRLAAAVRHQDLLVRLGGDEFVIWCPDLQEAAEADAIAERVLEAMRTPVTVDGHDHDVRCSVGIALVAAEDGWAHHLDQILDQADRALYRAKHAGRDRSAT